MPGPLCTGTIFVRRILCEAGPSKAFLSAADVIIDLKGSLHLPNDIAAVQAKVRSNTNPGSSNKPWFYIKGKDVSLIGQGGDSPAGSFYSYGQQWWDIIQKVG